MSNANILPSGAVGVNPYVNYFAQGILRHHFWGDYSCEIDLDFVSEREAKQALPALHIELKEVYTDPAGKPIKSVGWIQGETYPNTLLISAGGDDVDRVLDQLESFGADRKAMMSTKRGIDKGEPFKVKIPHVYIDHPNQIKLAI
ncbi:MAG: hypothetical protein VW879_06390 [Opitutae bacterium]